MPYIGNKMSVRAYEAYENGEKPISKWLKSDIEKAVLKRRKDFNKKELNRYNKEALKAFLICSSWHHTGSYFNETNFYSLDENFVELPKKEILDELNNRMDDSKKAKEAKKKEKLQKCLIKFIEWKGTRKHPKAVYCEAYGILKGKWIYTEECKKSLNGKYIQIIKEFDKAPRGTAQRFKNIKKRMK